MKALLVNPWIEDFAAYDFWLKPLGLLYVAAYLEKLGFELHLIDLMNRHDEVLKRFVNVPKDKFYGTGKFPYVEVEKPDVLKFVPRKYKRYGAPEEYFYYRLKQIGKVDIVFVTSTLTYWYPGYWDTIAFLKEFYGEDVPIVFGGFYVRNLPSHAKKTRVHIFPSNDLNRLPRLLEEVLNVRINNTPIDWFLLPPKYELYNKLGYLVFITTIGCPFKCSYCIAHRIWNGIRFKPYELVLYEIEKYVKMFNVKDIVFFDDAILVNSKRHFKLILKELVKKGYSKYRFHLPNGIHAKLIDEEIAELMKELNFKTIKLGYETAGELQIKTGGKVVDKDLVKAARILRKVGFTEKEVSAYIMVNIPGQTVKDVKDAIKFCKEEGIGFSINEYTPIVGTDDWIDLINGGRLTGREDPILLNNTVLPFWWKYGMDEDTIQYLKMHARKVKEGGSYD
ncbi:radical SAM protein [Thermosipho melanesiensis]|uniref:Radical SAM domain protein n=2 Tax=Thermosipho melanesiensis TaxID=46541 RepID=A6LMR4_THEM4|nr:radical SAM protein [Thermosipho melanesiensis]ABR31215.1 Radical SAM domain protein [Thermosipho melanesiensis BI429]APT74299.1 radical SAM protein [Thermosipho melanesiensis]OOC36240.1 radical SAM protein [Thermosipho melanesiensis]OOC37058.1 radical SAM protein [Thermosipho melanesiensis]OOC37810.1 radical SAM protein [Thermosipho melanesiensis]